MYLRQQANHALGKRSTNYLHAGEDCHAARAPCYSSVQGAVLVRAAHSAVRDRRLSRAGRVHGTPNLLPLHHFVLILMAPSCCGIIYKWNTPMRLAVSLRSCLLKFPQVSRLLLPPRCAVAPSARVRRRSRSLCTSRLNLLMLLSAAAARMPPDDLTGLVMGDTHDDVAALGLLRYDLVRCSLQVDAVIYTGDFQSSGTPHTAATR